MTEERLLELFDEVRWQPGRRLAAAVEEVEGRYLGGLPLADDELDVWAAGDPSAFHKDDDDAG